MVKISTSHKIYLAPKLFFTGFDPSSIIPFLPYATTSKIHQVRSPGRVSVIKILFVMVAVVTSAIFIQTVATVTWMEELAVLPVGALLVVMFLMAYALYVAPVLSSTDRS